MLVVLKYMGKVKSSNIQKKVTSRAAAASNNWWPDKWKMVCVTASHSFLSTWQMYIKIRQYTLELSKEVFFIDTR